MKTLVACSGIGVIIVLCGMRISSQADDAPQAEGVAPPAEAKAMLDAAQQAWHATQAAWDAGAIASIDSLYVWSRRWLEAVVAATAKREQHLVAYLAHRERMKIIHNQVAAKFRVGAKGGEAATHAATQFYLAEAELWAKRAAAAKDPVEKPPLAK